MKTKTTSALSGCIVWILSVGILSTCLLPVFSAIGSITSFSQSAIKTTGNFLCPEGTTPERSTYNTTMTDKSGNTHPATGVELHCVDKEGTIVKTDPVVYSFLWIGIFAMSGLLVSCILAFALAAPASVLITRALNRRQKLNNQANFEPL